MTTSGGRAQLIAPLRIASFRWLVVGRAMIYFCNAVTPIVLGFAVLDLGGSVVAVGLVVGARSLANVTFLLLGGVLADRLPRAMLLQGAGAIAALAQGAVAAAIFAQVNSFALLAALSVVNGVAAALSVPTSAALMPQAVPPDLLRSANAVSRMAINAGLLLGASGGGVLAGVLGSGWGVAITGLAFMSYSLAFIRVRVPRTPQAAGGGPFRQLRIGWAEFVARSWVWAIVLQFTIVNAAFAGGIQVLGLTIASGTIGRRSWGLVLGAQTIGAIIGGIIAVRWRPRHQLRVGVGFVAFVAVPLVALAYAPHLGVLLTVMFVNGMALEQFAIAWDTSLQENIPGDRLARVYAFDALGSFVAIPLGEMIVGPVSLAAGTGNVLVGLASLVLAVTATVFMLPSVRAVTTQAAGPDRSPTPATSG